MEVTPTWQLLWAAWSTGAACEALMKRSATVWMSRIRNCIFKDGRADWKTCVLVGLDSLGSDVSGIYIFQNWGRKEFQVIQIRIFAFKRLGRVRVRPK